VPPPDDAEVLRAIKGSRAAWVTWLKSEDLADVGSDPKRHSAETRARFWQQRNGDGSGAGVPAAPTKRMREPPSKAATSPSPAPEMKKRAKPAATAGAESGSAAAQELLAAVGADGLKQQLQALGLKCGGRPIERAERLLAARAGSGDRKKKALTPSAKQQERNKRQKAKREQRALQTSETAAAATDRPSTVGKPQALAKSGTETAVSAAPRPVPAALALDDGQIVQVIKANSEAWVRWLRKNKLASRGADPERHDVATRRRFAEGERRFFQMRGGDNVAMQQQRQQRQALVASKRSSDLAAGGDAHPAKRPRRLSTMLARARSLGVTQATLDDAMDTEDPRTAVVAALATTLRDEKLSALLRRARSAGVDQSALDAALDLGEGAKEAVVQLLAETDANGNLESSVVSPVPVVTVEQPQQVVSPPAERSGKAWIAIRSNHPLPAGLFSAADAPLLCSIAAHPTLRPAWLSFLKASPAVTRTAHRKRFDPSRHPWATLAAFVGSLATPTHRELAWDMFDSSPGHRLPAAATHGPLQAVPGSEQRAGARLTLDIAQPAAAAASGVPGASMPLPSPRAGRGFTYPAGPIWDLVRRTEAHPQYDKQYLRLPSAEADWVKTTRKIPTVANATLVAIDCEMAATTHDDRALVGVGLVGDSHETVLDALVLPPHQVHDSLSADLRVWHTNSHNKWCAAGL
jgi:hypothetical protein